MGLAMELRKLCPEFLHDGWPKQAFRGWLLLATLAHCVGAGAQPAPNYQGLWWAAPAGVESGWGINFAHQGDQVFATWYTYDTSGEAWWLRSGRSAASDKSDPFRRSPLAWIQH